MTLKGKSVVVPKQTIEAGLSKSPGKSTICLIISKESHRSSKALALKYISQDPRLPVPTSEPHAGHRSPPYVNKEMLSALDLTDIIYRYL